MESEEAVLSLEKVEAGLPDPIGQLLLPSRRVQSIEHHISLLLYLHLLLLHEALREKLVDQSLCIFDLK